jgi:hypothetical protein
MPRPRLATQEATIRQVEQEIGRCLALGEHAHMLTLIQWQEWLRAILPAEQTEETPGIDRSPAAG